MSTRRAVCYGAALLLGAVTACAAGPLRHLDLEYVPDGHERHRLDLHLPEEGKNWPLVVWIHGGAWRTGDKKGIGVPAPLLDRGFAVASLNYRLSQHAVFPAQIQDVKAAIRWLRANAAKYGYNADRIGAWGPSAGGHLVALLGVTGEVRDLDAGANAEHSSRVQAVVDYFGPTDFLKMDEQGGPASRHSAPNSPESALVGGPIAARKDMVARANPITYVSREKAKQIPPFLIVHGDADNTVPHGQSVIFHEALRSAGAEAELILLKGSGHGGPAFQTPEMIEKVASFFRRHLTAR